MSFSASKPSDPFGPLISQLIEFFLPDEICEIEIVARAPLLNLINIPAASSDDIEIFSLFEVVSIVKV